MANQSELPQQNINGDIEKLFSELVKENGAIAPFIETAISTVNIVHPFVGVAIGAVYSLGKYYYRKDKTFFSELNTGLKNLPLGKVKELNESDEFRHFLMHTHACARKAHSEAKIRRFAQMLASGAIGAPRPVDEYEELLRMMDTLSDREWEILCILSKYQPQWLPGEADKANLEARKSIYGVVTSVSWGALADKGWPDFTKEVSKKYGWNEHQLNEMVLRLESLAVLQTQRGYSSDFAAPCLSESFYSLKKMVEGHEKSGE